MEGMGDATPEVLQQRKNADNVHEESEVVSRLGRYRIMLLAK